MLFSEFLAGVRVWPLARRQSKRLLFLTVKNQRSTVRERFSFDDKTFVPDEHEPALLALP